ncbi:tetratricopeptide-like helical [Fusarium tjaetaba]|uniref:Tetratricopeptide-like helical n=1 Tax=Fusarium tjaetaba TaxID=1567544 RepID=A0A8H5R4V3_9HYPO|nr:tetratricopeptide-like helical [Fusarium tjaetaba]KAF5626832.1 tetratricopeptide-like helical [Fusarium tjaetaba]
MPLVSIADLAHAGREAYARYQLDDDVDTLSQAIGCLKIVNDHVQLPFVLADLGVYLHDRYGLTGNSSDLEEAITFESESLARIDPDYTRRAQILNNLGQFYNSRFESTSTPSDLQQAVAQTQLAVMEAVKHEDEAAPEYLDYLLELIATQASYHATENDSTEAFGRIEEILDFGRNIVKPRHYDQIANLSYIKSEITSQLPELLKAISHAESALNATGDDPDYRAIRLTNLANYQLTLYEKTFQGDILRDAIRNTREAVELASKGTDNALVERMALASALHHNYHWSGQVDDLDEAIEIGFQVVTATAPRDEDWLDSMQNLSLFVKTGFKAKGVLDDLTVAIDLLQYAMKNESLPLDSQSRSAAMALDLLEVKYESTRSDQDFAFALNAYNTAIDHQPEEPATSEAIWKRQSHATATISTLFRERFERLRDPQDIDTSIILARRFLSVENSLNLDDCSSALALALWTDFRFRGGMEKLDEAVDLAKSIVKRQPPSGADYLGSLNNLSGICQTRYDATGNEADLQTCIDSALEGLGAMVPNSNATLRIAMLLSASSAYISKAERFGDLENVQLAVRYASEARDLAKEKRLPVDLSTSLDLTLSQALALRYHYLQALADLVDTVRTLRHARITSSEHFLFPIVLNNLGEALRTQFSRTGDVDCLIESTEALEQAVLMSSPGDPAQAMYRSNLSLILFDLFKLTQERETLDSAIESSDKAIQETVLGNTQLPERLNTSGSLYAARFELTKLNSDMDEAISQTQAAVDATPADNPQCAKYYNNLGGYFMKRSLARELEDTGSSERSEEDMKASLQAYKHLLYMAGATPLERVGAGYSASSIAYNDKDLKGAQSMIQKTIEMLPKISPLALERSDQEHALSGISGLSSYATSIVLEAGADASRALQLQEAGRGVIAGLAISARNDISDLEAQAPELAAEYKNCRHLLSSQVPVAPLTRGTANSTETHRVDRYELNKKLDALEDKIRQEVPGFQNFQQPLSTDALKALASKGPVVSFNVSHIRSDAFIITQTDITSISLPDLKEEDLNSNARLFLERPMITRGSLNTKNTRNASLLRILKWLWDVAVHPVLKALDIGQRPKGKKLPRIWWTSSGLMALMPIHAAGDHTSDSSPNMFDFAIPSYTTTLKTLAYARETKWKPLQGVNCEYAFIVSPNKAREDNELSVEQSAYELNDMVQQHCKTRVLIAPDKAKTLSSLASCNVVFFGCHGQSMSTQPCKSYLQLGTNTDSHLTIQEIQGSRHQNAQLAYLSACSTANVSARHLVDEVVHIAGAFSLLGFQQVVGTFWEAKNSKARVVAKRFYEELMLGDGEDEDCIARAYYTAVMELRASKIQDPLVWATFAHFGA